MSTRGSVLAMRYLDAICTRLKKRDIAASLAYLISLLILLVLLGVLGDHFFGLPIALRIIWLSLATLSLALFAWFAMLKPLFGRVSVRYAARLAESSDPDLNGNLTAFAEYPDMNSPVADALADRVLERLEHTTPSRIVPGKPLLHAVFVLMVAFFVFVVYGVFAPKSTFQSIMRLFQPASAIAAPTSTSIVSVSPGNALVLEGSDVVFRVVTEGRSPAKALLYRADAPDQPVELARANRNEFEGLVPAVISGFSYTIHAGDAVAGPFHLVVHPAPVVNAVRFTVKPPAYTGLQERVYDSSPVKILRGSSVVLEMTSSTDIHSASMMREGKALPLTVLAPRTAGLEWQPEKSVELSLFYIDTEGFRSAYSPSFRLEVVTDEPPAVVITAPLDGIELPVTVPVIVRGLADDDLNLVSVRVITRLNDGEDEAKDLPVASRRKEIELEYRPQALGWKAGDRVSIWIEATDNCQPEAQKSISKVVTVTLVDPPSQDMAPNDQKPEDEEDPQANPGGNEQEPENPQDDLENPDEETPQPPDDMGEEPGNGEQQPQGPGVEPQDGENPEDGDADPEKALDDMAEEDGDALDKVKDKLDGEEGEEGEDKQPKEGEPKPEDTENKPDDGDKQPADGEKKPDDGEKQPADGEKKPDDGEKQPGDGEKKPDDGEKQPADGEKKPDDGEKQPGDGEKKPEDGEQQPADGEKKPADGEKQPGDGEKKPDGGENQPAEGTDPGKGDKAGEGGEEGKGNKGDSAGEKPGDKPAGGDKADGEKGGESPGDKADEPKGGEGGSQPGGGSDRRDRIGEIEGALDAIDKALEEGRITEADLEKEGLTKERRDEYRRMIRNARIRQKEARKAGESRRIREGKGSGDVGKRSGEEKDIGKEAREAARDREKVTGGYRDLQDEFQKSIEADE